MGQFRIAIGLPHAIGVHSSTILWPPGAEPLPPKQWSGRGQPTFSIRRDAEHQPVSAKQMALGFPKMARRRVTCREGTDTMLSSRSAAVRVRPAHRDYKRSTPPPEEWCLIEWPAGEPEPTKHVLSALPVATRRVLAVAPELARRSRFRRGDTQNACAH